MSWLWHDTVGFLGLWIVPLCIAFAVLAGLAELAWGKLRGPDARKRAEHRDTAHALQRYRDGM